MQLELDLQLRISSRYPLHQPHTQTLTGNHEDKKSDKHENWIDGPTRKYLEKLVLECKQRKDAGW